MDLYIDRAPLHRDSPSLSHRLLPCSARPSPCRWPDIPTSSLPSTEFRLYHRHRQSFTPARKARCVLSPSRSPTRMQRIARAASAASRWRRRCPMPLTSGTSSTARCSRSRSRLSKCCCSGKVRVARARRFIASCAILLSFPLFVCALVRLGKQVRGERTSIK